MRLWSLHPHYLDPQGLVALWREALLAQAVLLGETRGYRNHPQLERFRAQKNPLAAIGAYLAAVHAEAGRRGYAFDGAKIATPGEHRPIAVTTGQLAFEWRHLECGFNRWMQHTRNCVSRRSVADEVPAPDLLHGKPEGPDVGALAKG